MTIRIKQLHKVYRIGAEKVHALRGVDLHVGKNEFVVWVTAATRAKLLKPRLGCPMTATSLRGVIDAIRQLLPPDAAGHYHQPLLPSRHLRRCP